MVMLHYASVGKRRQKKRNHHSISQVIPKNNSFNDKSIHTSGINHLSVDYNIDKASILVI